MKIIRKIKMDGGVRCECAEATAEEEQACLEFKKKYKVRYVSETRGIYGGTEERTLSYYACDFTDENLTCIFAEDGELVGCECKDKNYYLNGQKSYIQVSDSGPQGPLIWDSVSWELVKR